jgi:hypothetical protein
MTTLWHDMIARSSDLLRLSAVVRVALDATLNNAAAMWFVMGTSLLSVAAAVLFGRRGHQAIASVIASVPLVVLAVTSGTLAPLFAAAALFAFAILVGLALLRLVDVAELTTLERYVFATTVGLGLTCAVMFVLGATGAIRGEVVLVVAVAGASVSAFTLYRRRPAGTRGAREAYSAPIPILVAGVLLLQAVIPFVTAPELMYDALYYHLTMVRVFIEQGAMVHIPELFASDFPLLPHLIYVAPSLYSSIDAPKFVHFGVGILTVLAVYATGARLSRPLAGVLAAVAWLSVPLVLWEMSTAYVDLFSVIFTTCAVLAAIIWIETRRVVYAALGGVAIGLGFGVKVSMVFLAAPLMLVLLLLHARTRRDVRHLAIGVGIAALLAAPWYVRSFVLTGNPVFPFLNAIFRSPLWEPLNENFGLDSIFGMGRSPLDLLALPWRLVMASDHFGEVQVGALGILPLLATAGNLIAILFRGRHSSMTGLFLFGSALGWFVSAQYARYALPMLAVGAVAFGQAVALLSNRAPRIVPIASAALLCGAAAAGPFFLLDQMWRIPNRVPWGVDLGQVSRSTFISAASRHYQVYEWMRKNLADYREARVLGVGQSEWPLVYSESRITIAHMTLDGRRVLFAKSPEETMTLVKELGFRYVIVDYFPRPPRFLSSWAVMDVKFMQTSLQLLYANRYVYLYAVADSVPAPSYDEQLEDPRLTLKQQDGHSPWLPVGGWQYESGTCAGVLVTEGAGLIQAFSATPNTLYTLDMVISASTPEVANGKLQVNWIDSDGALQASIETNPISKIGKKYSMSTTSPPSSVRGIVYVTGYGAASACIEWASLRRGP